MSELYSSLRITTVAPTVAAMMGIEKPALSGEANPLLMNAFADAFKGETASRVLIYNPDAVALWIYMKYTERFYEALRRADYTLPMLSVMPSVTPVCFASIYSGAMPAVHGIQKYEKPVLRCDTLYDAAIRSGIRPAIVGDPNCSMSKIFLERDMDYYVYDDPEDCVKKGLELIADKKNRLVSVYNGNYDAKMHRFGPESAEAIAELDQNISAFSRLYDAVKEEWREKNSVAAFCPDHGCHEIDGGLGSHGLDMQEDMNVVHLWSFLSRH